MSLLTGEYDYSCTPAMTKEAADAISGCRHVEMPGIGHLPTIDNYGLFRCFLLPELDFMLTLGGRGGRLGRFRYHEARQPPMTDDAALFDKSMPIRREVLGFQYVDASMVKADDFMMAFQRAATAWAWGWAQRDPTLDRKTHSLLNLAMLTALDRAPEIKLHVKGALANGITVEQIKATLLHATAYCGIPAGLNAFKAAHEALVKEGILPAKPWKRHGQLPAVAATQERTTLDPATRFGFVGLGTMGASMATNLLRASGALAMNALRREAAGHLLAEGASWASPPRELAGQCDVVFTSLPSPIEVAFGPDRVREGLRPGVVFDLGA